MAADIMLSREGAKRNLMAMSNIRGKVTIRIWMFVFRQHRLSLFPEMMCIQAV